MMFERSLAHDFQQAVDADERQLLRTLVKRKQDAEEIREISAKSEARRRKAYKNYEDACNIRGKFLVRSCPTLQECYAKNKLKFVPLLNSSTAISKNFTTTAKPASDRKISRMFLERALASEFLNDNEDNDAFLPEMSSIMQARFLLKSSKTKNAISPELAEETKERRDKAFEKYEEYCEKRKFRINSQRNCPPLKKDLCKI